MNALKENASAFSETLPFKFSVPFRQGAAAKYGQEPEAILEMSRRTVQTIQSMASLASVSAISCPPPRQDKEFDLPTLVAQRAAKRCGIAFFDLGSWIGTKGQLKDVSADQKWQKLEKVGFSVNPALKCVEGDILIVDDIYQSGSTMNFLRSKLTGAGIARASSLCLVKAARDTDNQ